METTARKCPPDVALDGLPEAAHDNMIATARRKTEILDRPLDWLRDIKGRKNFTEFPDSGPMYGVN